MLDQEYIKRKENLVIKDFETAFRCYEKLVSKVIGIRQWTITIMAAMIVITLTDRVNFQEVIIPVFITLSAFLVMELRERSSMRFDKNEIIELEKIFMIEDNNEYYERITRYKFRDLKLRGLNRKYKLKHLTSSAFIPEVIFWYSIWIFLWFLIIIYECYMTK